MKTLILSDVRQEGSLSGAGFLGFLSKVGIVGTLLLLVKRRTPTEVRPVGYFLWVD